MKENFFEGVFFLFCFVFPPFFFASVQVLYLGALRS